MLIYYHNKQIQERPIHEKDSYHRTYSLSARNGAGGCGSSAPAAPDPTAAPTEAPAEATTEPAAEGGKLIVGFDAEFPPFGYIAEDGNYDGFDLALAQEVCARLGWEYEAVAIDWASKDAELKAGNHNCIWNGFTLHRRRGRSTPGRTPTLTTASSPLSVPTPASSPSPISPERPLWCSPLPPVWTLSPRTRS